MNIFHHIFSNLAYFFYKLTKLINRNNKNILRVIMYHDIKKSDFQNIENQIQFIKKDGWKFLHPSKLFNISEKNEIKGKNIILTFDDGFFSNIIFEKEVLSKYKIKAAFFIPYNFMKSKNKNESIKFIKNKLKLPNYKPDPYPRLNMNFHDIIKLNKKKHIIGFHTKNHIELSKCKSSKIIKDEISGKMDRKFKKIILKNKFFSFPFGKLSDINDFSYNYAKKKYNFIFLGIRGNNKDNISHNLIFRDNFLSNYNKQMTLSIINGYFDLFYQKKRNLIYKKFLKI